MSATGLRAYTDAKEIDEPVDYLILLTKTRDTATALASADGLREQVGTALSLQNSVTKDDLLVDWIGEHADWGHDHRGGHHRRPRRGAPQRDRTHVVLLR